MKKNLLDIQQEIREIDGKVKDISFAIAKINDEINALRKDETIAVEAPDKTHSNFKWKVKQQEQIEKGDVIATYKYGNRSGSSLVEIKAPCSGTLLQFRKNCINYGVISHESDNKDSIKAWAIQRR